jgi:hypothetical protein
VSPWVIYNLTRFEKPLFLAVSDGGVLMGANCDSTYYGPLIGLHNGLCGVVSPDQANLDQSIVAEQQRTAAFDYIGHHLNRLPIVIAARFGRAWSIFKPAQMAEINQAEGRPLWVSYLGLVMYWPLTILAAVGIRDLLKRRQPIVPLVAPLAVVTINAIVFFGFVRHRIGAEVPLVLLGAIGGCHLLGLQPVVDDAPNAQRPPRGRLRKSSDTGGTSLTVAENTSA